MGKAKGRFHSLAVSGQACSGKSILCRVLSEKLKWRHFNVGNEFRKLAKREGLEIDKFGSVPDSVLRKIDKEIAYRIQTEEKTIWDGRLTCYFARNNLEVFKVYCIADLNVRHERCADRDNLTTEEAKREIAARDSEEESVFERLYGVQLPYNRKWVNHTLDTSSDPPEVLADRVIQALRAQSQNI